MAECCERPYGRERISAIHFPVGPIAEEPHWKMDGRYALANMHWLEAAGHDDRKVEKAEREENYDG